MNPASTDESDGAHGMEDQLSGCPFFCCSRDQVRKSIEWSWQFCTFWRHFGLKDFWWGYAKTTPGYVASAGE